MAELADQDGNEDGTANASDDRGVTARYLLPDLPDHIREEHIQNYFSVLGEIEEVTVKHLTAGGGSKLGSVKFRNPTLEIRNLMLREAHEIEGSPVAVMTWKMQKLQKPGYQAKLAAEAAAKAGGRGWAGGAVVGGGCRGGGAGNGASLAGCEGKGGRGDGCSAVQYQGGGDAGWSGKGGWCHDWGKGAWGDYNYTSAASNKPSGKTGASFGFSQGYGPANEGNAGFSRSGPYAHSFVGMGGKAWKGSGDYSAGYGGKCWPQSGKYGGFGANMDAGCFGKSSASYGGKPDVSYGGGCYGSSFGGGKHDSSGWCSGSCYGGKGDGPYSSKGPMNGWWDNVWGTDYRNYGGSSIVGGVGFGKGANKAFGKKGIEDWDVAARYLLSELPDGITEDALRGYFSAFGDIEEVVVKHIPSQGMQGSVKFKSPTMELRKLMLKESHEIEGHRVVVETWKMRKLARPTLGMSKAAHAGNGDNGCAGNAASGAAQAGAEAVWF